MASSQNSEFNRIKYISISGGFLDGQKFVLSAGLNCIIGARGTGKTTVLELLRYALNAMPGDGTARKRIETLVEKNLAGGRADVYVETKDGFSYIVTRSAGEEPVVLMADGTATEINLNSGSFFRINVFSQNEVESIADRTDSQLDIIDNFESERINEVDHRVRSIGVLLEANSNKILPHELKINELRDDLQVKPSLEEKLKAFAQEGGENAETINAAHAQKSLRDREIRAIEAVKSVSREVHQSLNSMVGHISQRIPALFTDEILNGPNREVIRAIHSMVSQGGQTVDGLIENAKITLVKTANEIKVEIGKLDLLHKQQEVQFQALIEKYKEAQSKASERSHLEKKRNEILQKEQLLNQLLDDIDKLKTERQQLLEQLSELRDERFQIRQSIVDRINSTLSPSICVDIVQFGNPEKYRILLTEELSGNNIKQGVVAGKIVNTFNPMELVEVVKQKNKQKLTDKAELSELQAEKVLLALSDTKILFDLETVELADLPTISLNDGGSYKTSSSLSTGQKCTAILPILLMDSENPLLIDQPEDNLDNRFIYETIVDSIGKVKKKRQLLFVTHNPNIPVLGEADKVIVLESDGTNARMVNQGTVDHCKDNIVTLLEGGEDAFNRRKDRYAH